MIFPFLFFIGLLIAGRKLDTLSWRAIIIWIIIFLAGLATLAVFDWPPRLSIAFFGIIEIALVLNVFNGDIKIR